MSNVITDEKKIDEALSRGTADVLPTREKLKELLMSGKRIKLYQGFDPTSPEFHIGHMVGFRKMRQFQDLGHHVIFLIGDGTGQAGDPTGKSKDRGTFFTQNELRKNAESYKEQAGRILDFDGDNPVEILWNSEWLNELKLVDVLNIANHFTLQQLFERDMFQERLKKGEPVNLREFLYPLLQGYDSVAMEVDLEIGGNDQLFNMMTGRTLCKNILNKEKFVLTTPLLADSEGKKIGKTEGNAIGLGDMPHDLYGKIMSLGDDVILPSLESLTDVPMEDIKDIESQMKKGENPKPFKKQLALEIVKQLNDEAAAEGAQAHFEKTFEQGSLVSDTIPTLSIKKDTSLMDALVGGGIVSSKTDFRRLVKEGAVRNTDTDEKITDEKYTVNDVVTLKIGKKRFVHIEL